MEKNIKVYWLILIALIIISMFIFIETAQDDSDLVTYFGFAGSVTSLVLGLIAIFYSIITNQQSTENFGKLNEAVSKIEKGAFTMENITKGINDRLDKISNDIIKFGMKDLGNQIASNSTVNSETPIQDDANANMPDIVDEIEEKEDNNG